MLDELVDVIETLKSRIDKHRSVLQGNEAQTRLSLIDPLLRALGWDTADPALVRPEFNLNNGRADYALLGTDEKPVAIIEAKRLDESLGTTDRRMQMLTYANFSNVSYAGLTDGNQWVLYKVFDQKSLEERIVLNVSIANDPSPKCALQLLLLWRPNLASGKPIEAKEPILGTQPESNAVSTPDEAAVSTAPDAGWIALREVSTAPDANRNRPQAIKFPNGEEKPVKIWLDFLTEVAEWLIRDGALTPAKCPVPDKVYSDVYVVNLQPKHPRDIDFARHRRLSNGMFLYSWGNAKTYVDRSIALLEYLGKDPSTVHVQVG